jgi:hypothetical protein
MKLPRFSLRTLLVLIALISIPMAWTAYQLNWIRQRHEFLRQYIKSPMEVAPAAAPWQLRFFGEDGIVGLYDVPPEVRERADKLFPEAKAILTPARKHAN